MQLTLAANENLTCSPVDVVDSDRNDLRCAKPESCQKKYHGVIAPSRCAIRVNSRNQGFDLLRREMPGQGRSVFLCDARNAWREIDVGFPTLEEKSKEV